MPAQSYGTVLMMTGGALMNQAPDELCQAFNAAAAKWCARKKRRDAQRRKKSGRRIKSNKEIHGDFTEAMTRELKGGKIPGGKSLATKLAGRERGFLVQKGGGFADFVNQVVPGKAIPGVMGGRNQLLRNVAGAVTAAGGGGVSAAAASGAGSAAQSTGWATTRAW
ncbi:MAG TPA: hypothetical protein VKP30_29830, partial [Polyangiaceae bacterium]|nr:hypothetical protein [Polyangiaceae bacterium]